MSRRLITAVFLFALCGCGGTTPSAVNSPPYLLDLDGQRFEWPAGVYVVVFTRSDCPISNRYAPVVHSLRQEFHPRGVEFFLVYVDPRETPDTIRAHLRDYDYRCAGLRDAEHILVKHCGAQTTPEAVVFDADGTMTYRGRIDDRFTDVGQPRAVPTTRDLADAIEATLARRPVARPRTDVVGCLIVDVNH